MKSIRNLCLIGAAAVVAACDPYTAENKGQPQILEVFASGGNSGDGVLALYPGEAGAAGAPWSIVTTSTCTPPVVDNPATTKDETAPQAVTTDAGEIFVKFNKLLDGASIQSTPTSCDPAGGWLTVTRNGVAEPAGAWKSCYNPSSPTSSEGASIILYRGADVTGGPSGSGTIDQSIADASTTEAIDYVLTGSIKDKQGNVIPIDVTYRVEPDAGPLGDVTVDATAGTITWEAAQCDAGAAATAGYRIYKQDPTDDAPVALADVPAGTLTYTDPAPSADREYFIAALITNPAGGVFVSKPQGPFTVDTNP